MRSLKSDHQSIEDIINQLQLRLSSSELGWAFETLDVLWETLSAHVRAENICLFPALLNAPKARFGAAAGFPEYEEVKATLDLLRADHNYFLSQLASAMKELRNLMVSPETYSFEETLKELQLRIKTVATLFVEHNEIEESIIYRWPDALLDSESLALLQEGVNAAVGDLPAYPIEKSDFHLIPS